MATYEVETRLSAPEVLDRADTFFGEQGLGLESRNNGVQDRSWYGGGGAVFLVVYPGEHGSRVEIGTREWDVPVREFLGRLPRRRGLFP